MAEYTAHDLAVREQAFKEAAQLVAEIAFDLRDTDREGFPPSWRGEATATVVEYAGEMVKGLAGRARADLDAQTDAASM